MARLLIAAALLSLSAGPVHAEDEAEVLSDVDEAIALQVACIEAKESGGRNVWNSQGSGAGGVLQYFPATFARGARELGHAEWSLWNPEHARTVAAHDLLMGRRNQWAVSGCR